MPALFVIGAGPGIGRAVARRFAGSGFDVGLLARSASTVDPLAAELSGVHTATATADVADEAALTGGLERLVAALGVPEVLVYNAGVVRADTVQTLDAATLRDTYAVNVGGAVTTASVLLPRMAEARGGSYLLTAGVPEPLPELASLSLGKAGLRALAELLDRQFGPAGGEQHAGQERHSVRTATITVCGPVAAGTDYDPDDIAEHYARLHGLPAGAWPVDVRHGDPADAAG